MLFSAGGHAQDATALRSREAALGGRLADNPFQRPLVIESSQADGVLRGDVYAVVGYPYSVVGPALQGMDHWCDILMLHLNVKDCVARGSGARSVLNIALGRRFDQPLTDAFRIDFTAGATFMHMAYSYTYGGAAELAMRAYLATTGRNKVGFTIVDHDAEGAAIYLGDVRGVIERNAMRYYLAIEGYLAASGLPAAEQSEQRLQNWFSAVERYPRQLHEMERGDYLSMKHHELARRQAESDATPGASR